MTDTNGGATLQDWIGRRDMMDDIISPWTARALNVVLGRDPGRYAAGWDAPPGAQWIGSQTMVPAAELGEDGHEARGGFLPPVPLPRRMWAGGTVTFHGPLRIGEPMRRISRVIDVTRKDGRSGPLVFVAVEHKYYRAANLSIEERQDIVYRQAPQPGAPAPVPPKAPAGAAFSRRFTPDAVTLFRYSALTFNGHLIHYDRDHCRANGYPGLVVHGPLIATLLMDLAAREGGMKLGRFTFRAVSPLFEGTPFTVNGRREGAAIRLWAANADGGLAMEAEAHAKD